MTQVSNPIPADDRKLTQFCLISLLLLLAETSLLFIYFALSLPFVFLVGFHGLTIAVATLLFWSLYHLEYDLRMLLLLWISVTFFGPFGSAGSLLTFLFYFFYKRYADPFEVWYRALFPTIHFSRPALIYERIISGWDDYREEREVLPFIDFMRYGSLAQKHATLEIIAQNFSPDLSPLLRQALDDPSNSIRIEAASIVAKFSHAFETRRKELRTQIEAKPHDHSLTLELAQLYDQYAFSDMLDEKSEEWNRQLAITFYENYLQEQPESPQPWLALGRLLSLTGQYTKVINWFAKSPKDQEVPQEAYVWYLDALFMTKQYEILEEETTGYLSEIQEGMLSIDARESIKTWNKKLA